MDISLTNLLFLTYQVLLSAAILALSFRLLSRRALVLIPVNIYLWVVAPFMLIIFIGMFLFFDSFSMILTLLLLLLYIVGLFVLRRDMNGPLIFNCEKKRLLDLLLQILQEHGVPFSQERAFFSVNDGQSTIQISGYSKYVSLIQVKGKNSFFKPVAKKLQMALKDERIAQTSPVSFSLMFMSFYVLGHGINLTFSGAFEIDLRSYGEIIYRIGQFGTLGIYVGGSVFAFVLLVYAILLLIPKPLALKTSVWRWGGVLAFVWLFIESFSFLEYGRFNFIFLFQILAFGAMMFFWAREIPMFCSVSNLRVNTSAAETLKEILAQQQLDFQEVGNDLHLKSGTVIEVWASPKTDIATMTVIGRNPEPKLFLVEQLFADSLRKLPGKPDIPRGLGLLLLSLPSLIYVIWITFGYIQWKFLH